MTKRSLLALFLFAPSCLSGYAVLSHEAIIDTAWSDSIRPLLLKRFPGATPEQLKTAHGYAYGGAILQDMGYYPFGSKFFSDLVHYVRSGDFVEELLSQSQDLDEYAFALGSLAHYFADNVGHAVAVNLAVPLTYPRLRAKYGPVMTYDEDPSAHLKVEFGFDVMEVAQGNYAPQAYHDFIGFGVSERLLQSAFRKTYGLEMADIFSDLDLALGSYRRTVSKFLPEVTKVAWHIQRDEIVKARPGVTQRQFIYNVSRSGYEKEWGKRYERPGPFAIFLAILYRIVPKVGPLRYLELKPATPETARLFMKSFNQTLDRYRGALDEQRTGRLRLVNLNFDTGRPTGPGEYWLADDTYAKLARTLAGNRFASATPEIAKNVLAFFGNPNAPISTRRHKKEWRETERALSELKALEHAAGSARKLNHEPALQPATVTSHVRRRRRFFAP